jgi:F-type H+-transporting ATPase subunit epsilon
MAETFQFELLKPDGRLLAVEASEVVIPGVNGYFGVRADHHPLLSLLGVGVLTVRKADGTEEHFAVADGHCEVCSDKVTVLAEVAESAEEVDVKRAERARERATERIKKLDAASVDMPRAQSALERAEVRLRVAAMAR